jgi:hypothetical protein
MSAASSVCPHCGARSARGRRRRLAVWLGLAGSASLGLTMMACYGAPPCEPGTSGCPNPDSSAGGTGGAGGSDAGTLR